MRTTISLEDRLAEEVKRRAAESGESVSAFNARVLYDSLKREEPAPARPFRAKREQRAVRDRPRPSSLHRRVRGRRELGEGVERSEATPAS